MAEIVQTLCGGGVKQLTCGHDVTCGQTRIGTISQPIYHPHRAPRKNVGWAAAPQMVKMVPLGHLRKCGKMSKFYRR